MVFEEACQILSLSGAEDKIDIKKRYRQLMKRSTNGGGENSPILEGEDDFYEDFFVPLLREQDIQ